MAELNVQFVRPDRALFQGPVASIGHQDDEVIVLADHARRTDDIDPDIVRRTRDEAIEAREACDEGDHRRAYYDNKVNWCNLLLKQTMKD